MKNKVDELIWECWKAHFGVLYGNGTDMLKSGIEINAINFNQEQ